MDTLYHRALSEKLSERLPHANIVDSAGNITDGVDAVDLSSPLVLENNNYNFGALRFC